eukprot:646613-Rhodomonas_salina.1
MSLQGDRGNTNGLAGTLARLESSAVADLATKQSTPVQHANPRPQKEAVFLSLLVCSALPLIIIVQLRTATATSLKETANATNRTLLASCVVTVGEKSHELGRLTLLFSRCPGTRGPVPGYPGTPGRNSYSAIRSRNSYPGTRCYR